MSVLFHPDFPKDVRRYGAEYGRVSASLAVRFRQEVDGALSAIKSAPEAASHFIRRRAQISRDCRRGNLRAFPFFVLYGTAGPDTIIGALIPCRSDPLTWLTRFGTGTGK